MDINELWVAIFIVLTPDGVEAEYYNFFEDYIRNKGYAVGSAEYWQVTAIAEELLDTVIKQYIHTPAFEYVVRGVLVDVTIEEDKIILSMDYDDED